MDILIIGKVWPEPASSAAGSRMIQLIDTFLEAGWQVSFASAANRSEHTFLPQSPLLNAFSIELNASSFDDFILKLQPGLILFDRFSTEEQYGWRVALNCPKALRVLDTEDLHCLREARSKALKENRPFEPGDLVNDIAIRELASIYRCDLSLIISPYEMQLLTHFFKVDSTLLHYLPFLPAPLTAMQQQTWPSFSERKNFISIGNFLHAPNWDAVLFMKHQIWPLIRKKLPEAELEIYGAYPSHKVFDLHALSEGFLIKGRANQVADVMSKARLCLAPLRFGAGLKGKLLDAMQAGTPSVTTSIGAEGMQEGLDWGGGIANEPEDFAALALMLYQNEALWNQAQKNSTHIYTTLFESGKHKQGLLQILNSIKEDVEKHRHKNFTGAMLQHHSLMSTKYMALWIEAKNKNGDHGEVPAKK